MIRLHYSSARCHPAAAWFCAAILLAGLPACHSHGHDPVAVAAPDPFPDPNPAPVPAVAAITGMSPLLGPVGTRVTLSGVGLQGSSEVLFAPRLAAPAQVAGDGSGLTVVVPAGAQSGPVQVLLGAERLSFPLHFLVTGLADPPVVRTFSPGTGPFAGPVTVTGSGFLGATQVAFGGVPALRFRVLSDQELLAAVPAGGAGPVTVTTLKGTGASAGSFRFDPGLPAVPVVQSLIPASGPAGTQVRLQGTGLFGVTAAAVAGLAAPIRALSDTELALQVPAGAGSGPVTLTRAGAPVTAGSFTVVAGALPVITGFVPASARPYEEITVSGSNLDRINGDAFIGAARVGVSPQPGGTRAIVTVQPEVRSGPIRLLYPGGEASSFTDFQLQPEPPQILALAPRSGPPGTVVTLTGVQLNDPGAVRFGGVPATAVLDSASGHLRVLVPAGAVSGPVEVTTAGGRAQSLMAFQVLSVPAAPGLRLAGAYLTQATQRLDGSVPLVAGREARLRVFPVFGWANSYRPQIQVTLGERDGRSLLTELLPTPAEGVPAVLDESDPLGSWDLEVPAGLVRPGLSFQARILPGPGLPDLDPAASRFPADGAPWVQAVTEVPPLAITLVPVFRGGHLGRLSAAGRPAEAWLRLIRQIYPLRDLDFQQGPAFTWEDPAPGDRYFANGALALALEAARLAADPGSRRYQFGVFRPFSAADGFGVALFGQSGSNLGRAGALSDLTPVMGPPPPEIWELLAHELGHCFGRQHAPCGTVGFDLAYPYPAATLGATGFDLAAGLPRDPVGYRDIMSYCNPNWVSDYTYKAVLGFRAGEAAIPAPAPSRPGLLVWGVVKDAQATLLPSFEVAGISSPPAPGEFLLTLRDPAGAVLQEVPFSPINYEDSQGDWDFAFVLPLTADLQSVASLTVTAPKLQPALLTGGPLALPREPVATVLRPGTVHLSWDAGSHPMALVKDPSGAVIGIVRGGSADFRTEARELQVLLSSGVRSVSRRVPVL